MLRRIFCENKALRCVCVGRRSKTNQPNVAGVCARENSLRKQTRSIQPRRSSAELLKLCFNVKTTINEERSRLDQGSSDDSWLFIISICYPPRICLPPRTAHQKLNSQHQCNPFNETLVAWQSPLGSKRGGGPTTHVFTLLHLVSSLTYLVCIPRLNAFCSLRKKRDGRHPCVLSIRTELNFWSEIHETGEFHDA